LNNSVEAEMNWNNWQPSALRRDAALSTPGEK